MRQHLGFLRFSSLMVKVAAWTIFLFFGVGGSAVIALGRLAFYPRWMAIVNLAFYTFLLFFLYLIAKIADLLTQIINTIHKE